MSRSLPPDIEDLLRQLAPQVLGALVRRYGHFDLAEDAVQEALLAAASTWSEADLPREPRSWLITVASRRLTDLLRNEQARRRREDRDAALRLPGDWLSPGADTGTTGDDSLVLLFLCCHPALTPASQVALTLRAVGGLSTTEIARAFLVSEASMTRRITRAKQQIARSGARFTLGRDDQGDGRLAVVLHTLYLIFTEGYATTSGPALHRPELTNEAIRLTRLVHGLLPEEPEVAGLLALMLLTDARRPARTGPDGALVTMEDQDRTLWRRDLITEGIALIEETLPRGPVGSYQLQAAVAAVHAEAKSVEDTDWRQIVALYDLMLRLADNPVVELNRAIAIAMASGPQAGLDRVESLGTHPELVAGHRWHSVRAQLLQRLGRNDDARRSYLTAARLTTSLPHVRMLHERAAALLPDASES